MVALILLEKIRFMGRVIRFPFCILQNMVHNEIGQNNKNNRAEDWGHAVKINELKEGN